MKALYLQKVGSTPVKPVPLPLPTAQGCSTPRAASSGTLMGSEEGPSAASVPACPGAPSSKPNRTCISSSCQSNDSFSSWGKRVSEGLSLASLQVRQSRPRKGLLLGSQPAVGAWPDPSCPAWGWPMLLTRVQAGSWVFLLFPSCEHGQSTALLCLSRAPIPTPCETT